MLRYVKKKDLRSLRFSGRLNLSEKVESVMLMHVRHFAMISIDLFLRAAGQMGISACTFGGCEEH